MDQDEAIKTAVEIAVRNTNDANSLLIYITLIAIGALFSLCIYIFNRGVAAQAEKNRSYEQIMKTLTDNQSDTNTLLAKIELQLEYHSESIKDHKEELKSLRKQA